MEELLAAFGLTYDELRLDERETVDQWMDTWQSKQMLTLLDVQGYLKKMKDTVARSLAELPDDEAHKLESILLKARLQNYIFLDAFLTGPAEARAELESYINRIKQTRRE